MLTRLFALALSSALLCAQPPTAPFGIRVRNAANNGDAAPGALMAITLLAPELQDLSNVTAEVRIETAEPRPLALIPPPTGVPGVWVIAPKDAPDRSMLFVTLIKQGVRYTGNIVVQTTFPGLFTADYSSVGPALAISYGDTVPRRNALTSAAVPERFVSLFATGLNGARESDVTVDIAGQTVPATWAGPQGTPGLDQINFIVPKNAPLGCYVPLSIRVRGVVSNSTTLSINSDPFACAHPLGLSYSDMKTLDAGGSIPLISLSIQAYKADSGALSESGVIQSSNLNAATAARISGFQIPNTEYFSCKDTVGFPSTGGVYSLLGGPSMLLTGPQGRELDLKDNPLLILPPGAPSPFYIAGNWLLHSYAGASPPFDLPFRLPPMILSTNISSGSTVSSERDLEVTWNPAGFGAGDVVIVARPGRTCTTDAWTGRVNLGKPVRAQQTAIQVSVIPHPASRSQTNLTRFDGSLIRSLVTYNFTSTTMFSVE